MTISKSQGQTFRSVGIYFREPVFTHGQLYVALSRVSSFDSFKIKIVESDKHGKRGALGYITKNIVYKDILINKIKNSFSFKFIFPYSYMLYIYYRIFSYVTVFQFDLIRLKNVYMYISIN
jgi:hypothetical protein